MKMNCRVRRGKYLYIQDPSLQWIAFYEGFRPHPRTFRELGEAIEECEGISHIEYLKTKYVGW